MEINNLLFLKSIAMLLFNEKMRSGLEYQSTYKVGFITCEIDVLIICNTFVCILRIS